MEYISNQESHYYIFVHITFNLFYKKKLTCWGDGSYYNLYEILESKTMFTLGHILVGPINFGNEASFWV